MHASIGEDRPNASRIRTGAGQVQLRLAIAAEEAIGSRQEEIAAEVRIMGQGGMRVAVERVMSAKRDLDAVLGGHNIFHVVARDAAMGHAERRGRTRAIVAAQEELLLCAGAEAMRRARILVERIRAFNTLQPEWAAGANSLVRRVEVAEVTSAVKDSKLRRPRGSKYRFVGFSINGVSPYHHDRPVTMVAGPGALLAPLHPVMYTLSEVRAEWDVEEIDSPKPVRLIEECEVRVHDGTLANLAEVNIRTHAGRIMPEGAAALEGVRHAFGSLEPR